MIAATDGGLMANGWQWSKAKKAGFFVVGNSARRPDLAAPGKSIVSAHPTSSSIDSDHPEGRVAGDVTGRFRGSGTSEAAAVVSGAAALLLQAYPKLTPDQVTSLLVSTADAMPLAIRFEAGACTLDMQGAWGDGGPDAGGRTRPRPECAPAPFRRALNPRERLDGSRPCRLLAGRPGCQRSHR